MITFLKNRPPINTEHYVQMSEPVQCIEDLESVKPECDSKCFIINVDNPITYIAFYDAIAKNWIVMPFSCNLFVEKAVQFELNRTYKVRVD